MNDNIMLYFFFLDRKQFVTLKNASNARVLGCQVDHVLCVFPLSVRPPGPYAYEAKQLSSLRFSSSSWAALLTCLEHKVIPQDHTPSRCFPKRYSSQLQPLRVSNAFPNPPPIPYPLLPTHLSSPPIYYYKFHLQINYN